MSTISASTTSTTAFKVTSDTTGTLVFQTGASPTTAMSISSAQIISFTNPPTATGGGSVATNTAYGTSALAANTTGTRNTAVGSGAAGATTTGNGVTAVGYNVLANNITGTGITAIGGSDVTSGGALQLNTSGNFNTAVGTAALFSNTTASNNTAVGYQAGYSNTTGAENSFLGYLAGNANTTGSQNTFIGRSSGVTNQTGTEIVAVGFSAMGACGTAANYNTAIGRAALNNVTGTLNVGLGNGSGSAITSGSKNTIIGSYNGNQGGLDIRTASNYIVLSDGDGNPAAYRASTGAWVFGLGGTTAASFEGALVLNGAATTGRGAAINGQSNGSNSWSIGDYGYVVSGTSRFFAVANSGGGGVYLNGSSATSWTAVSSDARQKKDFSPVEGLAEIMQVVPTKFRYEWETESDPIHMGFTAQNLLPIIPDMVVIKEELHEDGTPLMTVTPDYMIPVLVKAIQELKAEFDAYKEAHP